MALQILIWLLQGSLILVCVFMVLLILMQRPRHEGLGAAFGSGFTESIFGAETSNILSRMTIWCAALFFILTLSLTAIYGRRNEKPNLREKLQNVATQGTGSSLGIDSTNQAVSGSLTNLTERMATHTNVPSITPASTNVSPAGQKPKETTTEKTP